MRLCPAPALEKGGVGATMRGLLTTVRRVLPSPFRFISFDETMAQLHLAFDRGAPFALIRVSDGENTVLQWPRHVGRRRLQGVFRRAFESRRYDEHEIAEMRDALIAAVRDADIVGLWDDGQFQADCAISEDELHDAGILRATACHPEIQHAMQSTGELARLIGRAKRITLITGRDVIGRFRRRFPYAEVDQLLVPTERIYRLADAPADPEPHFPNVFRRLAGSIRAEGPGHLFLVGAGFPGKVYCVRARATGGIAVDIGSVFDYWMDIPTREGADAFRDGAVLRRDNTEWPSPYLFDAPAPAEARRRRPDAFRAGRMRRRKLEGESRP